jgi:hypothetical protein
MEGTHVAPAVIQFGTHHRKKDPSKRPSSQVNPIVGGNCITFVIYGLPISTALPTVYADRKKSLETHDPAFAKRSRR